jgi:uroporphyrinogen-III synthase
LVQDEIRKGCSPNVAAQRVAMFHPNEARASVAKREAEAGDFLQRVDAYRAEHKCDRTVAMEVIRKRHPDAFNRFQNA